MNTGGIIDYEWLAKSIGEPGKTEPALEEWPEAKVWPEPEALPDSRLPVDSFNYGLLPASFSPWVADIAKRMQCPPDYVAVAALVALSSVIGKKVGIQPKQRDSGFKVICNLWGMQIGRPSEMKTPALNEAMKPLKRLEIEAKKQFNDERQDHEALTAVAKLTQEKATTDAKQAVKKGDKDKALSIFQAAQQDAPEEPTRQRYIVNDATVEKLGELLNENPNGLLLERDELSGFLNSLQREDHSNDRAFYLEAFNGGGRYTYDRIGRGTIDIEAVCVSIVGTIQPGKLTPYIRNAVNQGIGDDGLMQRFQLAVYPDSVNEWSYQDNYADTDAKNAAYEVFHRLAKMEPPEPVELDDDIFYAHFDSEAQNLFIEWWTALEKKIRSDDIHPAMEAHLAKYRSLAPSLALITELADCEIVTQDFQVTAPAFIKAAAWCDYLESHAKRIYGMAIEPDIENAKTILKKIRAGKLVKDGELINPVKVRDIQRKKWAGLTQSGPIKQALHKLEDYGWMRSEVHQGATGRTSLAFNLHPSLTRRKS